MSSDNLHKACNISLNHIKRGTFNVYILKKLAEEYRIGIYELLIKLENYVKDT